MQGLLPEEAMTLLVGGNIPHAQERISAQVERVLCKLWNHEELNQDELGLDLDPPEVAAVWSMTHRRPISTDTARQVLRRTGTRSGQIKASREWGTGAALRRMYRLGDVLPVQVQERKVKPADEKMSDL